MKAEQSISELLYNHNCVIVPDFGGFVANPSGARILKNSNTILPPSKKIAFNARLSENDGLLVSFLSKKNNETYADSVQRIKFFTDYLYEEMESGHKVTIEKVGTLYFDNDRNIQFEADNRINYLTDSFGLTAVHAVQVDANVAEEVVRPSRLTEVSKPENKSEPKAQPSFEKRKTKKWLVAIPVVAAFVAVLVYNNNYQKLASPFNQTSATASYANYTDSFIESRTRQFNALNEKIKAALGDGSVKTSNATTTPVEVKIETETVEAIPAAATPEIKQPESIPTESLAIPAENQKRYYIITGQFSVPENANRAVESLKQNGFEAEIAGERNGLKLVSCFSTTDISEAKTKLAEIKSSVEKYAWILK